MYRCESWTIKKAESESENHSVVSNSLQPHGLYSPRNSLGQNTGVGSLSLLQGIFPTQGSNPGLPHCRQILYQLSHRGSPEKAECQRIDAFELWYQKRLFKSPLDSKEFKPINRKGNQLWIFTGRTDAETPVLWPPAAKSRLTGKDPDAGKDCGPEEKGITGDEIIGWHH